MAIPSLELGRSCSDALGKAGYECRSWSGRQDAAELAEGADCVLIDWDGGDVYGQQVMSEFRSLNGAAPVIILASPANIRTALKGLRSGAADLLEKPVSHDDLATAVAEAISRAEHSARLRRDIEDARRVLPVLSAREQQIIAGIVAGLTSREIADAAAVSVRTVETCRTRLLGKLGVPNTAALVRLAVLGGLPPMQPRAAEADA